MKKNKGVKKFIHTSTSEIYGTAKYVPIDENHPINSQSPYAASKTGADQLVLSYFKSFNLPAVILRPINTYGPRQSNRAIIPTVITQILKGNNKIKVGNTVNIDILDTPGHTMSHLCLLIRGSEDALFCGDTLFNAGVGNCHNGGNPLSLYNTFYNQLIKLDKKTKIYPGHDYLTNNLEFTLSLEPENKNAYDLLQKSKMEGFSTKFVSSFEIELKVNTFFRLKEKSIKESLKNENLLSKNDSPQEVFLALRELRNKW